MFVVVLADRDEAEWFGGWGNVEESHLILRNTRSQFQWARQHFSSRLSVISF